MTANRSLPETNGAKAVTTSDRWRIALIAFLVALATALHYGIDVQAGAVHDVLLRSYYLPIVLAGLWFGARGGLITAALVSVVFFPHAMHGWRAPYTFVFRLIEILMYNVIGGLTGVMSSRARVALAAEKAARLGRERAYDDLRTKTEMLFQMEEQLRRSERLAALGRMSAGLAHEIRNPLASIKTSVELLEEQTNADDPNPASSSRTVDLLQVLGEETERLNRILTEFLRFARDEARQDNLEPEECHLADVLEATLALVQQDLKSAGVSIDVVPDTLGLAVSVPEGNLRQVLLNLVLNAADAMPDGGSIRLGPAEQNAETITLEVVDSGHGIAPEVAGSIFDPFFSTKEGGVGLGLSIVARLLEASGGDIRLDHDHRPGARFLVTLPLADR